MTVRWYRLHRPRFPVLEVEAVAATLEELETAIGQVTDLESTIVTKVL
jgi:hypothetical protein